MATHSAVPHPVVPAAAARSGASRQRARWRVRPLALLLFGAADFCVAVGVGDILLGMAAAMWLLAAAALLLAGFAACD